jgi:NAD(P)-dependent dehydrogenase (short-subunit alcohol dehydrogenase family)
MLRNAYLQVYPPPPTLTEGNLPSQRGKVFVVTGGTSGVGLELAKLLYNAGATVYVTGRSMKTVSAAIAEVRSSGPWDGGAAGVIDGVDIDLSDLTNMKAKAEELLRKTAKIDGLILNAGVMLPPLGSTTAQGLELQVGVNCVAHLLLAHLLTPALVTAAQIAAADRAPPGSVRVVWTGSISVDINAPKHGFPMSEIRSPPPNPAVNYTNSKLGNWYLAAYFGSLPEIASNNILSVVQSPGLLKTNLQRNFTSVQSFMIRLTGKHAKFGAYTELWSALSQDLTMQDQGGYMAPWGRRHEALKPDLHRSVKGRGREFAEWCEEQIMGYR